jgi:hypothetical protein
VEDDTWIKLLVAAAWLFDTVDQALISYGREFDVHAVGVGTDYCRVVYHYTVTNFGNQDVVKQAVPYVRNLLCPCP